METSISELLSLLSSTNAELGNALRDLENASLRVKACEESLDTIGSALADRIRALQEAEVARHFPP